MKKILVIVDAQYDFAHENGTLYVHGANESVKKIIEFIDKHNEEIEKVIFTMDNHPETHISFFSINKLLPNNACSGPIPLYMYFPKMLINVHNCIGQ